MYSVLVLCYFPSDPTFCGSCNAILTAHLVHFFHTKCWEGQKALQEIEQDISTSITQFMNWARNAEITETPSQRTTQVENKNNRWSHAQTSQFESNCHWLILWFLLKNKFLWRVFPFQWNSIGFKTKTTSLIVDSMSSTGKITPNAFSSACSIPLSVTLTFDILTLATFYILLKRRTPRNRHNGTPTKSFCAQCQGYLTPGCIFLINPQNYSMGGWRINLS